MRALLTALLIVHGVTIAGTAHADLPPGAPAWDRLPDKLHPPPPRPVPIDPAPTPPPAASPVDQGGCSRVAAATIIGIGAALAAGMTSTAQRRRRHRQERAR